MMRNKIGVATLAAALALAPLTSVLAATATSANAAAARAAAQDDEPSDAEQSMFTKGQNLYLQGRYEQAAGVLNNFLKTYPNSVITDLTLLWLGRAYMQLGRLPEAEQVGQRLRAVRDTPFIDIYDSELQAARADSTKTRPTSTSVPSTTTPDVVAAARPTPTPRQTAQRSTPTLNIRPTPTPVPQAIQISPAARRTTTRAEQQRLRRANVRPPVTTPTQTAAVVPEANTNANLSTGTSRLANRNTNTAPLNPRRNLPSRRTTTPPTSTNANTSTQIASNTPPRTSTRLNPPVTRTPARTNTTPARQPAIPTPTPVPPPVSSDPALSVTTTTAPFDVPTQPQSTGSSGSLSFTVKQVPGLQLALRRAALAASPGQPVQLPLTVTNVGNKEDQFRLETDLSAEFQPTFSLAQNGTDTGLPILVTPQMARGASLDVLLNIRIPDAAPDNQQRPFFVRAASQSDPQIFKLTDATLTVVAAALSATSGVSQEMVMPGDTFTQTITVRNQGSAAARSARADFVFNPDFELVSASPSPLAYDRPSRTAIWSLGELDSRASREITVTLRAVGDALASNRTLGRGTMRTASLIVPSNFDGPSINVGRVTRARIDAVSRGLTATPGDTVYVPFVVRNPSNYGESYDLRITAPGAPVGTIYSDSNGDGRHQDNEPAVTQTSQLEPRGGQYPLLLRVDIPRSTPDRQQYAYNLVVRAAQQNSVASEASTVLTVAAPHVRVRSEQGNGEISPGDTFFYRLVLVNDGGGLAKNLVVNEMLPAAIEFVSSDPSLSTQDAASGAQRFVWRVTELAPGDTAVLLVTARLRSGIAAESVVSPTHTLSYQDTNSNSYTGQ